ncbi:MAG TPA: hypothetical protein DEB40_04215 [Elusimicrobia bacterium]|nr:hypothetical protein [Elusimicrobiota bacterium]HBT60930.1 hypothetical protein [Elusimicrobiota bacterium]
MRLKICLVFATLGLGARWIQAAPAPPPFAATEASLPQPDDAREYEAQLVEAKGDVTVYTAEEPEGGPAERGMPLEAGDRIKTGAGSSAEIGFSSEHFLHLHSNSEFTLGSLQRADCELKLSLGGVLAKIQALAGERLSIRSPGAVASVRGTEFAVEIAAGNSGETHVGVFDEGLVEVRGDSGPAELLKASEETRVLRGGRPQAPYQLRRFVRDRQFMRGWGRRLSALRKNWRALPVEKRRELRQGWRRRAAQSREQVKQRRQRAAKPAPAGLRQDQKKMQERKNAIRERLRRRQP